MKPDEDYLSEDYVFAPVCTSRDGNCMGNKKLFELQAKAEAVGDKELVGLINEAIANPTNSELQYKIISHEAITNILDDEEYLQLLIQNFKSPAPQGNKLFSNFNENLILKQLHEMVPTFKNYDCVLMDFYNDRNEPLAKAADPKSDLIRGIKSGEIRTFGTIPNTLVSTGDTSRVGHWVALFGDFRDANKWTIEYYNSTGQNAPAAMFQWMKKLAEVIRAETNHDCEAINVSNIDSQHGPSECGMYALHYVICRSMGVSYKDFRRDKIPDKEIEKLRRLFGDVTKLESPILELLRRHNLA